MPRSGAIGRAAGTSPGRHSLADLQRTIGNRAAVELLRAGQASLAVGHASDGSELEADAIAEAVVNHLATSDGQPSPKVGGALGRDAVFRDSTDSAPQVAEVGTAGGALSPETEATISAARRGGSPLPGQLRSTMERAFDTDFSRVRVHSGESAAELNDTVAAKAFTIGNDIFFRDGIPDTSTRAGQHLLAHELTHTIQQGASPTSTRRFLQRFPASALANPPLPAVDWSAQTASVTRAGEGKSGGVFFFRSKQPGEPVPSVVIKPNYGVNANESPEEAAQLAFGDHMIRSLFGVGAPTSRIVRSGTREFYQLVALCRSKDTPPTDEQDRAYWHPVSQAQAMIVMATVPNATSLSGLAVEAWDDPAALERLGAAAFAPSFLADLGKLTIADLLMGNDDRINVRAMNVGNMMVSSVEGEHKLVAIDSRAVLGTFNPERVIESGSASESELGTWQGSTKNTLDSSPERYVDGYVEALVNWMHGGSEQINKGEGRVAPENVLDPSEILRDTYQAHRDQCIEAFSAGWREGLAIVRQLIETREGRVRMKGLTEEFRDAPGSSNVRYDALKTNAMYLNARGQGQTHEEAVVEPARLAAITALREYDAGQLRLPNDKFSPAAAPAPGKAALSAALDSIEGLPVPRDMRAQDVAATLSLRKFAAVDEGVTAAKAWLAQFGTKTRGLFKRTEKPRNRVLLGEYIANCYLLTAGAQRALDAGTKVGVVSGWFDRALAGDLGARRAFMMIGTAEGLRDEGAGLRTSILQYQTALEAAQATLGRVSGYPGAPAMVVEIGKQLTAVRNMLDGELGDAAVRNLSRYADSLQAIIDR